MSTAAPALFFQEADGTAVDVHTKTAMLLFDKSAAEVQADTRANGLMRFQGKRVLFGLYYRVSPLVLAGQATGDGLVVTEADVWRLITFFDAELRK